MTIAKLLNPSDYSYIFRDHSHLVLLKLLEQSNFLDKNYPRGYCQAPIAKATIEGVSSFI